VSTKPARQEANRYIPSRSDTPGEVPVLEIGEAGVNEATGAMHVRKADGQTSTLPTSSGFDRIETLSQTAYDALVAATATISTVLYVVLPDAE
jgi:hypothetical protein